MATSCQGDTTSSSSASIPGSTGNTSERPFDTPPETPLDAVVMFVPDADHRYPWEDGYAYVDVSEALGIVQQRSQGLPL